MSGEKREQYPVSQLGKPPRDGLDIDCSLKLGQSQSDNYGLQTGESAMGLPYDINRSDGFQIPVIGVNVAGNNNIVEQDLVSRLGLSPRDDLDLGLSLKLGQSEGDNYGLKTDDSALGLPYDFNRNFNNINELRSPANGNPAHQVAADLPGSSEGDRSKDRKRCAGCECIDTPRWRSHDTGLLCNACWLRRFNKKRGGKKDLGNTGGVKKQKL